MSEERQSSSDSQHSWEAEKEEEEEEEEDGGIINPSGPHEPRIEQEADDDDMEQEEVDMESNVVEPQAVVEETRVANDSVYHQQGGCCHRVMRGVRALWATRQTEDTKENRELHVKSTLRELCVFIFFLAVLCVVAFGMTTTMTFYYTSAVTDIFIETQFSPSSTFKTIATAEDWYQYALGPLMKGLYEDMWKENVNATKNGYVLSDSKVLGLPRLRLVRVRNDSCAIHEDFRNMIKSCYGVYSSENEDIHPFGLMNGSAWVYQTEDQLSGSKHWGKVSVYGGGGYVQDLTDSEAASRNIIEMLRANSWLERGTRAVFIDFSLYNANINLFCVVRLLCEFPATGGVVSSWTLRAVKLMRYITGYDYFIMACECIFVLFIAYYIVEEILEIKRHRLSYFKSFWSFLDLLIIAISICCISFGIYRSVTVETNIEARISVSGQFVDLNAASYWQLVFDYTLAITVFLVWIKLFKFISFNRTMMQLSSTLSACAKDLIGFSVMFFIVFLAFAQLGYLLFGTQIEDYSKFESCIFSQFRILLGDFNFDELERSDRILGPAYFILFVFFMFFILMNMYLAIIIDTYSEVKAEMSHRKNDFEMTDYFKRGYQKMLDKLNLRRKKAVKVQKSTSTDKKVDYDDWHKDLKRRGYAEAEIVAVCSKYDLDKGRALTAAEVRKMQVDLDKKKSVLRRAPYGDKFALDSLDESDDDSSMKSSLRRMSHGGGVSHEEFSVLQRRVDRMEHSIGSIVSKIDAVLVKLENMERGRAKRRETMTRLLDSIAESEGITDESKQHYMERLVRDELERWDAESCISGFDPSPASSSSGRGSGRGQQPPNPPQEYSLSSNA